MGVAVLSGVVDSLDIPSRLANGNLQKWESHTPGTLTPTTGSPNDRSVPSRFIACVKREESAVKLKHIFASMGVMAQNIEISVSQNVQAVQQSDVVLLWCVLG